MTTTTKRITKTRKAELVATIRAALAAKDLHTQYHLDVAFGTRQSAYETADSAIEYMMRHLHSILGSKGKPETVIPVEVIDEAHRAGIVKVVRWQHCGTGPILVAFHFTKKFFN